MDIHNYPIDYAVTVTDQRVDRLLRERALRAEAGRAQAAEHASLENGRPGRWLPVLWVESQILRGARSLVCWLVSARG